jgi:hypothetical protein
MARYSTNRERLMDAAGERFYRDGLHARRAGLSSPDVLASSLILIPEGAAAMSAVQPADVLAKHARAASRALIASHK